VAPHIKAITIKKTISSSLLNLKKDIFTSKDVFLFGRKTFSGASMECLSINYKV
jgi:hypothetical protein